jgi:AhpD family alkylhydroperoxidase
MPNTARVNLGKQHPTTYKALISLSAAAEQSAAESGLDPLLIELVKLRTSQINGCAFCLGLHTRDAIAKGESTDRLATLSTWRETEYLKPEERAALTLAESITNIADTHVSDADYLAAEEYLSPEQISTVAWLTTVMNAFNPVAVTSRYLVTAE